MSKISDKQKNKRSNILDAAYELFTSKSFNNTSIDDVVKRAGIAKGTFYLYFKDKHDLMDRIVIYKSIVVLKDALKKLELEKEQKPMDFVNQMIFLTNCVVDYMQSHKELITLVDKKLSSCLSAFKTVDDPELINEVDSLIEENTKNGHTTEETIKEIYIIIDMVGSVCCDAIIYEKPFKLAEIKPILFSTIEKMLA